MSRLAALCVLALLGCASNPRSGPSLAPRVGENIDPRLPVGEPVVIGEPSADLAARLAELLNRAQSGDRAFSGAIESAERLAAAAGSPRSENWVAAQQALSAAVSARGPTTRALGDVDTLSALRIAANGWISPSDRVAIEQAAGVISAIDRRQAQRIEAIEGRLGS